MPSTCQPCAKNGWPRKSWGTCVSTCSGITQPSPARCEVCTRGMRLTAFPTDADPDLGGPRRCGRPLWLAGPATRSGSTSAGRRGSASEGPFQTEFSALRGSVGLRHLPAEVRSGARGSLTTMPLTTKPQTTMSEALGSAEFASSSLEGGGCQPDASQQFFSFRTSRGGEPAVRASFASRCCGPY